MQLSASGCISVRLTWCTCISLHLSAYPMHLLAFSCDSLRYSASPCISLRLPASPSVSILLSSSCVSLRPLLVRASHCFSLRPASPSVSLHLTASFWRNWQTDLPSTTQIERSRVRDLDRNRNGSTPGTSKSTAGFRHNRRA